MVRAIEVDGDAEASAAGFPGRSAAAPAHTSEQTRRRGAELGNQRAWRHGKRSAAAIERRAAGAAGRKAAGLILARLDALAGYRHRPRPIRLDQRRHLDLEAQDLLARLGVALPGALTAASASVG